MKVKGFTRAGSKPLPGSQPCKPSHHPLSWAHSHQTCYPQNMLPLAWASLVLHSFLLSVFAYQRCVSIQRAPSSSCQSHPLCCVLCTNLAQLALPCLTKIFRSETDCEQHQEPQLRLHVMMHVMQAQHTKKPSPHLLSIVIHLQFPFHVADMQQAYLLSGPTTHSTLTTQALT